MKTALAALLVTLALLAPGLVRADAPGGITPQQILPPGALAAMFDEQSGTTHDEYTAVQVMTQLPDGDMLLGVGGKPAISEGAIIARLTAANELIFETHLDEQGIIDLQAHDGKVYAPGLDPSFGDDWSLGNVYVRSADGVWTKKRNLPDTVHVVGQAFDEAGNWYLASYRVGSPVYIMRSADDGDTWEDSPVLCCAWAEGMGVLAGRSYLAAVPFDDYANLVTAATVYISKTGWVPESSPLDPYWEDTGNVVAKASFIWILPWRDGLLVPGADFASLSLLLSDGTASSFPLPFTLRGERGAVVGNDWLYVAATDGVYRSRDLVAWQKISDMAPTALGWRAPYGLLLSDAGDSAALWELDTRGLDDAPTAVRLRDLRASAWSWLKLRVTSELTG
jgi:hypothetical protein